MDASGTMRNSQWGAAPQPARPPQRTAYGQEPHRNLVEAIFGRAVRILGAD